MNYGYRETISKQKNLVSTGQRLSKKSLVVFFKILLYILLLICITGCALVFGIVRGIIDAAPDIQDVSIVPSSYSTTVYNNKEKEIAKLVTSGSNRIKVSIDQVPDNLKWAFIDTEDARFYEHNGIDIQGIGRAVVVAITTLNPSEGASTITQQVLKNNVFTDWTSEETLGDQVKRKLQEQYLAIQLEKVTKKETILETYLNTINLGSNTLGVQAASHRYFDKDVSDLTLSECAVIAGITQNPAAYNPIYHPKANAKRRKKILKNMLDASHITKDEYNEAMKDDVYSRIQSVDNQITQSNNVYSYFVDEVVSQVMSDLQEQKGYTYTQAYNAVYSGGLKIYTTQDSKIQKICNKELSNAENYPNTVSYSINWAWTIQHADGTTENYSESYINYYHKVLLNESSFKLIFSTKEAAKECVKQYKKYLYPDGLADDDVEYETLYYTPQPQASFTVMDQYTGYVKAIVGGRGSKKVSLGLDRATQSTRQPGSTFKVLSTYAPAIDTMGYTLTTKIKDEPFNYSNGRPVKNWYSGYRGTVTVRKAIADSMNVCAVKTLTEITPQLGFDYLLNFGFTTLVQNRTEKDGSVVSDIQQPLALGGITDGITNLEITAAYATIANQGTYTRPVFYSKVVDSNGRILLDNTTPTTHTVLKSSTASLLTQGMTSVITEGTGKACALTDGMPVSGKTGTTSSAYDLWFCGYTPYLTASIWTGYDENKELGSDQAYHERLWSKIMSQIDQVKGYKIKDFEMSDDVEEVTLCSSSGALAIEGVCPHTYTEYFSKDTAPTNKCSYHYGTPKKTTNESSTEATTSGTVTVGSANAADNAADRKTSVSSGSSDSSGSDDAKDGSGSSNDGSSGSNGAKE
ncbi:MULTISPECIES: transglycosylase domain-containing protein [unclassified Eubacterium (in: firmicutes)]|uniref:transglycosylase domain-containing protein n=1 Tax=Eubacterium TaxID=1730 RepID=UPI00033E2BE1|nr:MULTISPECIES: transglycosylase domain-containing protein [unclassified Eubacterium (in: firmicutes)]RGG66209.1 glycosyl transferase [Eubacterium sp. AF17-7]CDA28968.1 transglycosylase [Eubacterium sp. CAG:156]